MGPNGSGKSTLLKLMAGLQFPTHGEILINGRQAASIEAKKLIGYVPENPTLPECMTVRETLEYYANLSNQKMERMDFIIQQLHLRELLGKKNHALSRGMRQQVAVAQALISEPRVLLLDEPADGLDPDGAGLLRRVLEEQKDLGVTILIALHGMEWSANLIDEVLLLKDGKFIGQKPTSSWLNKNSLETTWVSTFSTCDA